MSVLFMALLDTTLVQFKQFIGEVTHSNPTIVAIQMKTPPIMSTVAQVDSITTLVTTFVVGSSFSLRLWASVMTYKRKNEEIPHEDFDFRQVA